MKKIDRRIIIVSAFIFIVGLAFGIMKFLIAQKEEPPARRDNDTRRYVQTTRVTYGTVESSVQAMGRLRSLSSVDIVAEASGKIIAGDISLKKGATFSKGDLLFTIYKDEAELDLQGKKSRFMHTLANLLPDIRIDYPDYEKSFTDFFNAVNIYDDLPPMPEINNEKLKVFMASRNVLDEYYGIRRDELRLKRHSIYAPFNGTYSDVYLEAGAYTNTGGRLAHAIQTDVLELEVPVKRSDAVWINNGDDVLVMRPVDRTEFRGEVIRKGSFIDDATQSQAIFIRLTSDKKRPLLNGEYLVATFPGYNIEETMEIPRNAVFNTDQVFVVNNDRLEKRTIDIVKLNEKTLVFRGLEEGNVLVSQPLVNVQEGTMVRTDINTPVEEGYAGNEQGKKAGKDKASGGSGAQAASVN
ncbi:MAG: HlyD family efflux transporter periplasmic adaptor subunit [Bacteroidales bacterium]|nr:HlyD family efflux transporter periplasmic adaptor subunit [Bacteroidales bacterium]